MGERKEEWKKIPGFGGVFWLSTQGRVYRKGDPELKDRLMTVTFDPTGRRMVVRLNSSFSQRTQTSVSLLLDRTFGLEGEGKYYVFKDGNPRNCCLDNVRRTKRNPKQKSSNCKKVYCPPAIEKKYSCALTINNDEPNYYQANSIEEFCDLGIPREMVEICFKNLGRAQKFKANGYGATMVINQVKGK